MELSDRAKSIPPSITLAISAKVKELKAAGKKIIAFGAGEPDFDTPAKDLRCCNCSYAVWVNTLHAIFGNARKRAKQLQIQVTNAKQH